MRNIPVQKLLVSLTLLVLIIGGATAAPIIPTEQHHPFLYSKWQPNRPNVILFMDPLCPYCKRIAPKLHRIRQYNLFIFWSPIFGERSERIISKLFHCSQPSAKRWIDDIKSISTSKRDDALCDGPYLQRLRRINNQVVESYDIEGVPSFYLQGKRVSFIEISEVALKPPKLINGVALDWSRYQSNQVDPYAVNGLAVVISAEQPSFTDEKVSKSLTSYVFSPLPWDTLCARVGLSQCSEESQYQTGRYRAAYYHEIISLLGLDSNKSYIIDWQGMIHSL